MKKIEQQDLRIEELTTRGSHEAISSDAQNDVHGECGS